MTTYGITGAKGLDFDLVKVGRPCTSHIPMAIGDQVHHVHCVRRKRGIGAVYQVDQSEVATPTRGVVASTHYQWRYLSGYNTSAIRITVLTLGGVTSTSADPSLTVSTTTAGSETMAPVSDAAAPTGTLSGAALTMYTAILAVTPNTTEDISIDQTSTLDLVRILSINVEELPRYTIDSTQNGYVDLSLFAPDRDIIDTSWDNLPTAQQTMRRYHKKILWSNNKLVTTTRTAARDIYTDSTTAFLQFNMYPSVTLPEHVGIDLTGYVLASNSVANNGNVTYTFGGGGSIAFTNITTGIAWYTATGTCAEGGDTMSVQAWNTAAGTLTVYGGLIQEQVEAA